MLDYLSEDIAVLATEVNPGPEYIERFEVIVVHDSFWSLGWRLCHRLRLTPNLRKTGKTIRTLTAAVESDRVHVVLLHYLTNGVKYDRVWMKTEKPVFIHCHGYDVTWDLHLHHEPRKPAHDADYVERVRALPEHVHFIANSKVTEKRLRDVGIKRDRIHLKYLGAPVPAAPPLPRDRDGHVTILYLGRLIDCKGPELVIRAFDQASKGGLQGRLVIAGDGPMRQECELARSRSPFRKRIELLGAVNAQTGALLRSSADIFTAHNCKGSITRQEEAFGVGFVEAMADGLAVVSGRSGALPEIIEDGIQGILFEPGDVEAHADALLRLARDPELRFRMAVSGYWRAREHFSLERERDALRRILGLKDDAAHQGAVLDDATGLTTASGPAISKYLEHFRK